MCGITGIFLTSDTPVSWSDWSSLFKTLFVLSESRGKEASGIAGLSREEIVVLRSNFPASSLVRKSQYDDTVSSILERVQTCSGKKEYSVVMGHSRLATTGSQHLHENNQPVRSNDTICIHNGIITNYESLWAQYPSLNRKSDLDSELISALVDYFAPCEGLSGAVGHVTSIISGTASVAVLSAKYDELVLSTNNGSLYYIASKQNEIIIFGSEYYLLTQTLKKHSSFKNLENLNIEQLKPGQCLSVSFADGRSLLHSLGQSGGKRNCTVTPRKISEFCLESNSDGNKRQINIKVGINRASEAFTEKVNYLKTHFPHNSSWQDSLRRCSRCVLTETMPYISFDSEGVCNYCRHHERLHYRDNNDLSTIVNKSRKCNGYDCIVGLSGGRDSVYVLHYVKKILNMNPIAYTYDWGMVTDLARRNIARICGKLGVEHIIISAHIDSKRKYIRDNVTAWLKRPTLGMIPLFMAGDKHFFYHLEQLKKRMGLSLAFLGENILERTNFKSGFAGIKPFFSDRERVSTLPFTSKIKMAMYYSHQILVNPPYVNMSLFDSAFAAFSYYGIKREYVNLFSFLPWKENEIISTIQSEYDFELAVDTESTWRIGDGTSAFYNYIYYTIAGFTENDTFRSNQIREGMLCRNDALDYVRKENMPRYETICQYLDLIGMSMPVERVFEIINAVPKVQPCF